jgi:integrase
MWWSSRFVHELRSKVDKHASRRLERWTIHGLRHTVATHLAEDLAVSETVIARILGHTPAGPRVTRVYLRAELLPERRAALERWAAWLEALQRGTDQRQRRADVVPLAR